MVIEQQFEEASAFIKQFVVGKHSLLEIGSGAGGMLSTMAVALEKPKLVRSISVPRDPEEQKSLYDAVVKLRQIADAEVQFQDSHSDHALNWAGMWAPYDVVFIDGDHDYVGVRKDWERFGPLGKIVAFHDAIFAPGVERLFTEIKESGAKITEFRRYYGIGVVERE